MEFGINGYDQLVTFVGEHYRVITRWSLSDLFVETKKELSPRLQCLEFSPTLM